MCIRDSPCSYDGYKALEQRAWVRVTAKVGYKFHNIYRGKGPVPVSYKHLLLSRTQTASDEKIAAAVALLREKNPTATIVVLSIMILPSIVSVSVTALNACLLYTSLLCRGGLSRSFRGVGFGRGGGLLCGIVRSFGLCFGVGLGGLFGLGGVLLGFFGEMCIRDRWCTAARWNSYWPAFCWEHSRRCRPF